MWKKIIALIFIASIALAFVGCGRVTGANMLKISPPENDDLVISGTWQVYDYKVLDKNMYINEKVPNLNGQKIYISSNELNIDDQVFKNVSYKLKVVESDYFISYESKFTVESLGINSANVITAADKSNNIFDFFDVSNDKSYIFYRGILLTVKRTGGVSPEDFVAKRNEASINSSSIDVNSSAKGVLIGLKTPKVLLNDGEYSKESYKTLWIYYQNGKVTIEEAPNVLVPRMTGMWTLNKETREINGHHQEYFIANPLYGKPKSVNLTQYGSNNNIYATIDYIGNNYVGMEVYDGNKFNGKFNKYQVLPVDNLFLNKGIPIEDIYNKSINQIYKQNFDQELSNIPQNEKNTLDTNVSFTNFTLKRYEGKWVIEGKVGSKTPDGKSYDFMTNIKPNVNLVRYDTLVLPWRILRADIPTIEDAYTSPDGKLAIIFIKGELLVYKITNNKLDGRPLIRYPLNDNDQVIMDEWCSGDYVNYWTSDFNEYLNKQNKEG